MKVSTFEELQAEFMLRIASMVYCNMATVDTLGHPRSRIMHPIWDGSIGWAISWPLSPKSKHLVNNPLVSLAYIAEPYNPVYVEATAEWIESKDEKLRIWELYKSTPPLLGFDPQPHYGNINHKFFGLLRFLPWRIELAKLNGESVVWMPKL